MPNSSRSSTFNEQMVPAMQINWNVLSTSACFGLKVQQKRTADNQKMQGEACPVG